MIPAIISFFRGAKFSKLTASLTNLGPILSELETNYANDKDARNAVIDTMIQILQAHKDA
jgi:hypothetical protein